MTQAAQQTTAVQEYLKKIVMAVQEAVDSGGDLLWQSPFFLQSYNNLVNPFRKRGFDGQNHPDGTPYRGLINSLILSMAAQKAAQRTHVIDNRFIPFSTMKNLYNKGARITSNPCKKEKKDSLNDYTVVYIFFPRTISKEVKNINFNESLPESKNNQPTKKIQIPTGSFSLGKVINCAHTNLVEIGLLPKLESYTVRQNPPIETLEKLIARFPHSRVENMETPNYNPGTKKISIPPMNKSYSSLYFYGTYCHELIHLVQDLSGEISERGIEKYSQQELEAEMGRCCILASLGYTDIKTEEAQNSIAYVRGWLSRLRDDPEILLRASVKAKRFADWVLDGNVPKSVIKNPERFPFLQDSSLSAA